MESTQETSRSGSSENDIRTRSVAQPVESHSSIQDPNVVTEDDCQLETYRKIAHTDHLHFDPSHSSPNPRTREIFSYHGGTDAATILGQALSSNPPRRFVRIMLRDSDANDQNFAGSLSRKSTEYLYIVGALDLPAHATW